MRVEIDLTSCNPVWTKYDSCIRGPGFAVFVFPYIVEVAVSAPGSVDTPVKFWRQLECSGEFNSGSVALAYVRTNRVADIVKRAGEDQLVRIVHKVIVRGKVI